MDREAKRHDGTAEHRVDVRVPLTLALWPPAEGMKRLVIIGMLP